MKFKVFISMLKFTVRSIIIYLSFYCNGSNIQGFYVKVKFHENTKCITLLFGLKSIHLSFH